MWTRRQRKSRERKGQCSKKIKTFKMYSICFFQFVGIIIDMVQ